MKHLEELLELLYDLLEDRKSPEDVIRSFEDASKVPEISKTFLAKGLEVIVEFLCRRLRESAENAIVVGKRRCWYDELVNALRSALKDAHAGAHLDGDVSKLRNLDYTEYESLLLNLEVRQSAAKGEMIKMIKFLRRKVDGEPIADGSISFVLRRLCHDVESETEAVLGPKTSKVFNGHVVMMLEKLLVGVPSKQIPAISVFHPGVQLFGARLLGLLLMACAKDEEVSEQTSRKLAALTSTKFAAAKGKFSRDGKKCLDILLVLFDLRAASQEHAATWAVLKTLKMVCSMPFVCKKVLLQGLLLQLDKVERIYKKLDQLGPPVYAKVKVLTKTNEKPAFILPPSIRPEPTFNVDSSPPSPTSTTRPHPRSRTAREALEAASGAHPESIKLLYLLGEDAVDVSAYMELCDRNMMLLEIKNVRRTCNAVREMLTKPFAR